MKKSLFIFITLGLICLGFQANQAYAAVTLVQSEAGVSNGGSLITATTLASTTTAGDVVVGAVRWYGNTSTISSVTDTASDTYVIATSTLAVVAGTHFPNLYTEIVYAAGIVAHASDTVAVTFSTSTFGSVSLAEVTPGLLDRTSTSTGNSANPSAGTVTTGSNGEFAIAEGILDDGFGFANGWFNAGSGWTFIDEFGGGNQNGATEYQNQSLAGAVTGNLVSNFSGTTGPWAASMATFNASSPPSITSFSASPNPIAPNGTSTLSWTVANATSLSISPAIGTVTGTSTTTPATTTTTLYTLTATNANGTSTATTSVQVATAPTAPGSFTVGSPSTSTLSLSWASSTPNNGATISFYSVYRGLSSTTISTFVATTTNLSYVNTGLATSTTYWYDVTAQDSVGNVSASSTNMSGTTLSGTLPSITGFSASPNPIAPNGTSTLSWTVANATSLSISPAIGTVTGTSTTTPATSTTTLYTLTATNANGTSTATTSVQVATAPTAPGSFTVGSPSTSTLSLSWASSTPNNGATISFYSVYRGLSSTTISTFVATTTNLSYVNTGLATSTTYWYDVTAQDSVGNVSASSTNMSGTTQATSTNNIYVAQNATGTANGADCNDAYAVSFFNNTSNWASTSTTGKISPGAIVHLCGTFTGTSNSTMLTFQGSGVSGNPITLLFENGANLTAPYWSGSMGGIDVANRSFITIDGGANGIIQNTANGDLLANQQISILVYAPSCTNCTIENMTLANDYVAVRNQSTLGGPMTQMNAIYFSGSNWIIKNNTIHDAGWALYDIYGNGDTNVQVYQNNIYNWDHAYMLATGGANAFTNFFFHDNQVHDNLNFEDSGCPYHLDGIHTFGTTGSSMSGIYIYNNKWSGQLSGPCSSGFIFMEQGVSTPSHASNVYIWNNVFDASQADGADPNGWVGVFSGESGVTQIFNNYLSGPTSTNDGTSGYNIAVSGAALTFENNISYNIDYGPTISAPTSSTVDYNFYSDPCSGTNNCFIFDGSFEGSFANWKSATGFDVHSIVTTSTTAAKLNSDGSPQSGSPVIGAAINLSSIATSTLATLAFDTTNGNTRTSVVRPTSGAWDIGAYQYNASSSPPSITSFSASPNPIAPNGTSTLSWTVANATSLSISPAIGTVTGTSTTTPATTTTTLYTLTATNANGTSTATTSVQVATAPTAPGSFTVGSPSTSTLSLSWASSTPNNGATISFYSVYRGLSSTTISTFVATTTNLSYVNTGLATSTTYWYDVTAQDSVGNVSASSTNMSGTTLSGTLPSITGFSASPNPIAPNGTSTLSWTVANATSLSISPAIGTVTGTSTTTPATSTTTLYTLTATNANGTSTATVTVTVTPPSIPQNLVASAISASEIDLSWASSTDSYGSVAGYQVLRNGTQISTTTNLSYADTGLTAATQYSYTVTAFDTFGNTSAQSSSTSATTSGTSSGGGSVSVSSGGGGGGGGFYIPMPTATSSVAITSPSLTTLQLQLLSLLIQELKILVSRAVAQGISIPQSTLALVGLSNSTSIPSGFQFTRDLELHDSGADVKQLQLFLIAQNSGSAAQILANRGATGVFGTLTFNALVEFQKKAGIKPSGYFGSITRNYVNGL